MCFYLSLNDEEDSDEDDEDDINYFKDSSDEKSGENQQQVNEIPSAGKFNLHEKRRYKINDLQQVRLTTEC